MHVGTYLHISPGVEQKADSSDDTSSSGVVQSRGARARVAALLVRVSAVVEEVDNLIPSALLSSLKHRDVVAR